MRIPKLSEMLQRSKDMPPRSRLAQTAVDKMPTPSSSIKKVAGKLRRAKLQRVLTEPRDISPTVESGLPKEIDQIEADLKAVLQGEVRFSDGDRAMYSTDGSNYRQIPIGVVIPKTAEDIVNTIAVCRKYKLPVLSRGGGTSLCGQCCNAAIVMDMSKYYNKILELNYEEKYARVQPGLVLDVLRNEAEKQHLTFAPDPSTHNHCTLGGMIGNNSCGTHSVMGGVTADNVHELDVVLYDGTRLTLKQCTDEEAEKIIAEGGRRGELYKKLIEFRDRYEHQIRDGFPKLKRRVSGYNLPALLVENGFDLAKAVVGSESTLVTVLEAKLRLVPSPPSRTVVVLGYPDVFSAGDHVPDIMKFKPIALEGLDDLLTGFMEKKHLHPNYLTVLPQGKGWLVAEFGGATKEEADANARNMMEALKKVDNPPSMKLFDDKEEEEHVWKVRESGLGGTARVPGQHDTWEGWEDSAVPPEVLGRYLRDMRKLFDKYEYKPVALYGHFGQGCLHCRVPFEVKTVEGIAKWRSFLDEAAHLVVSYGGSISGEHGDGQSKAELLPIMFGEDLIKAFEEFKDIWDPDWQMNPNKIVKPNKITQNLRLGAAYSPWEPETHFSYQDDQNSFSRATTKCVGVGECRKLEGGTMCPSYMVTREEKHSTRGRAHMLFEMLQGDPIRDGWQDENVKEALDLCLSCKGCKSDCPMNVDMATLKSEFLSHYYETKVRPRHAYAFGLIHVWSRIAAHVPNIANFFTQTPVLRTVAKFAAGVDQRRQVPKFATRTFKQWYREREPVNLGKPDVVLFPDTFNDHFHPDTAMAAVEVLESAGFHVIVPREDMCCGRPLYDYGMLDLAKSWLKRAITVLKPYIEAGLPVIFMEPSCAAVFKDELPNLMPEDEDGVRLRNQAYTLTQFVQDKAPHFEIPKLNQKVLLQVHCHHKSVIDKDDQKKLLAKMNAEVDMPEPGCCGMAGAFGYEEENGHCDVSMKVGEQRLLPAVIQTPTEQLIVADGFSCREQIKQGSNRQALHFAQALRFAQQESEPICEEYPERRILLNNSRFRPTAVEVSLFAGLIAGAVWMFRRLRKGGQ